jgi:DNA-binding Lrp family transcriptional regulator
MTTAAPYSDSDYKKYVFAQGQSEIWRIQENIKALDLDTENDEDLRCLLYSVMDCLRRAVFVNAEQAEAEHQQRLAKAETLRAEREARIAEMEALSEEEHRERFERMKAAVYEPEPEPPLFDPVAVRELDGIDNTYDDGRPVTTAVRYGEAEDEYVLHIWDPDPNHPDNQVGAVVEFSQGPHPWRHRYAHILGPDEIEIEKEEETEAALEGLSDEALRVHEAYQMARQTGERRTHRSHATIAVQLGMTEQEVADICVDLTARGLLLPATKNLTEDQKRVLNALPTWKPGMPEDFGPTNGQLAEQLGMSTEEIREHMRALDEKGWISHEGKPTSVLDALEMLGWQTPADEVAACVHMDVRDVEQRMRELADIVYQVRLV